MKKIASVLLMIILLFSLVSCGEEKAPELPRKSELAVNMDVDPLQTYGNQLYEGLIFFAEDENTVYAAGYDNIVKFSIEDPKKVEIIYDFEDEESYPSDITVMGDWVYFISEDYITDEYTVTYLNRMKKDGSGKTKLASDVNSFTLTEKEIYYEKYPLTEEEDMMGLMNSYVMSLDGESERELTGKAGSFLGIDNGWIYYESNEEDYSLYRMRPDGTKKEKVLYIDDDSINAVDFCIVDGEQVFYVKNDKDIEGKSYLIKKTIGGEETILDTFLDFNLDDTSALNNYGDQIYYGSENKLYKIDVNGEGERQLVYDCKDHINGISIHRGNVLVKTQDNVFYISEDGKITDLNWDQQRG